MIFEEILETIENDDIKKFAEKCIDTIPQYFWGIGASSTGKYHPQYALGELGLARHTIALVRILNYMFNVESIGDQFTSREKDLLRIAGMMHDTRKSGTQEDFEKSKYTKFNHPLLAAEVIRGLNGIQTEEIEFIASAIESHMGQWNVDKRHPDIVLPKPGDKYQIILHLADYLASRKDIEIKFEEKEFPLPAPENVNDWKFTFGKHVGKTIPEVDKVDHQYIEWAVKNMEKEPAKTLLQEYAKANKES